MRSLRASPRRVTFLIGSSDSLGFLPPRIDRAHTRRRNFLLYKATAAMLWAQSRYGTFNADIVSAIDDFDDKPRAP